MPGPLSVSPRPPDIDERSLKEDAFTVSKRLVEDLENAGATVVVHDPLYEADELRARGLEPYEGGNDRQIDAVVLQALHQEYKDFDWCSVQGLRVLLDGRNALGPDERPAGVQWIGVGRVAGAAD